MRQMRGTRGDTEPVTGREVEQEVPEKIRLSGDEKKHATRPETFRTDVSRQMPDITPAAWPMNELIQ